VALENLAAFDGDRSIIGERLQASIDVLDEDIRLRDPANLLDGRDGLPASMDGSRPAVDGNDDLGSGLMVVAPEAVLLNTCRHL
jgi:hypothetical protein